MNAIRFRSFEPSDVSTCLELFDLNCPGAFAPNERADYAAYLETRPVGYELALAGSVAVGAFGLEAGGRVVGEGRLRWILTRPRGAAADAGARREPGLGTQMMTRALGRARELGVHRLAIAASQRSEGFFARFGAREQRRIRDGWGPGMDRVEMLLEIGSAD